VAKSLGLSFVPLGNERYEMVTRKNNLDDPRIAALFRTVASDQFKNILVSLGGYDTSKTGSTRQLP
jgi:putative molybdopterin biosynthesis protein